MNEQEKAQVIQNDTLTLLLCNRFNSWLDDKSRAIQIARCCKKIRDRTKSKAVYNMCRNIIKAKEVSDYRLCIGMVEITELSYFKGYSDA